jgi:aminopeptidase
MLVMNQLRGLAEIAVSVGANVQAGQVVQVSAEVGHLETVRAVADAAYRRGARFVDVDLRDPVLQRSLVLHGPADSYVPGWRDAAVRGLDEVAGARIMIAGPTVPGLLDDLDPVRINRAQPPRSRAWREVEYRVNNTIIPGPNQAWAQALYPSLTPSKALSQLWRHIAVACRLDDPDPPAAWRAWFAQLNACAHALTAMRLDAIQMRGPGTDLRIGLLPGPRWEAPTNTNERGVEHAWNLPSEEIYTSPDPARVDGHVRLTRPAVISGTTINDVALTFHKGEVTEIAGGDGIQMLREFIARDPGTSRIGELALVDADSAVAKVGHPFGLVLLDENVASHVALGFGFLALVDAADRERINQSDDHLDLTIGSNQLDITGIDIAGNERPLLSSGSWQQDGN